MYINIVMDEGYSYRFPRIAALIAFESAARLGSFSQAGKELRTSQPAISRHIANLEDQLSAQLFERSKAGVSLTDAGSRFRDAVSAGLGIIHAAALEIATLQSGRQVVIACSNEAAHLFIMPRYDALQEVLGEQADIRILDHFRRNMPPTPNDPITDVVLTWESPGVASWDQVAVLREALGPICSPGYAQTHAEVLNGPVSGWSELTFLDFAAPRKVSRSWWDDWFEAAGRPESAPRYRRFNSYAYLLEAAIAGHGIALGWRGFIERHLETGTVVALADGFVETDNTYYCALTEKGGRNPLARKCLQFFEGSA